MELLHILSHPPHFLFPLSPQWRTAPLSQHDAQVRNVGAIYKIPHFSSHLTFVRNLGWEIWGGIREASFGFLLRVLFTLTPRKESYDQSRQHIKKQSHYYVNKGPLSQGYGFSSGHVWMWDLDYKESWVLKNWCFWTVVLEKTLDSPLDCKEIQPVHPKGDQFWVFIGRTDAEAETPILWPPDMKSWLIWKDPDAGRDWGQEEKGMTEDEMVGWHHWFNGHEFG